MDNHEYSWRWFELHSSQRLRLVNFWLISVAFLSSSFVQAQVSHLHVIAFGIALAGVVSSLAFMQLDVRTRQLVQVAEKSLASIEEFVLGDGRVKSPESSLVRSAHHVEGRSKFHSYRVIIQGLQLSVAVLFVLAALYTLLVY